MSDATVSLHLKAFTSRTSGKMGGPQQQPSYTDIINYTGKPWETSVVLWSPIFVEPKDARRKLEQLRQQRTVGRCWRGSEYA